MKKAHYSNYRVTVNVPDWRFHAIDDCERRHRIMLSDGEDIAKQVDRHCDGEGKARVEFDIEYSCSHCGYDWDEDENGMPQCCEEAQKEFEGPAK